MGIKDKAIELSAELKRSPDFIELKRAKTVIDGFPNLKQELQAFNKRQNELYTSRLQQSEATSRIEQLNKKYDELSKIPEIDRYLKASKSFNTLLADVLKEVNASIEAALK